MYDSTVTFCGGCNYIVDTIKYGIFSDLNCLYIFVHLKTKNSLLRRLSGIFNVAI